MEASSWSHLTVEDLAFREVGTTPESVMLILTWDHMPRVRAAAAGEACLGDQLLSEKRRSCVQAQGVQLMTECGHAVEGKWKGRRSGPARKCVATEELINGQRARVAWPFCADYASGEKQEQRGRPWSDQVDGVGSA